MKTLTLAEIVVLINNKTALNEEQFATAKSFIPSIAQKLISGDPMDKDELTLFNFVNRTLQAAKAKGEKHAEEEAKKAAAEAKYKQEMQAFQIELKTSVNKFMKDWKATTADSFKTIADVRKYFNEFVNTLPKEPKLEGVRTSSKGESSGSAKPWNAPVHVDKLKEGSSFKCLWDFVCANNGVTKKQMEDELTAKFPQKTANKTAVYDATSGRLPLRKEVVDGAELWFAVMPEPETKPDPELEIVNTTTEEKK